MYTISKKFSFSASHQLSGLSENHPCSRLHGHNYTVEIILGSGELSDIGFVVDYRDLSVVKEYLDSNFDHKHLNDVMSNNPTAENIAKMIFDKFIEKWPVQLKAVIVSETEKTWAKYEE